jgi:hypothetical protein
VTLKRGLTRLEGVADAKLILKPPHMEVKMKPGFWPDLVKMARTIKDAGYKPLDDGVELRVSGTVVKSGDGLALELDSMKAPLTLPIVVTGGDPKSAVPLGDEQVGQVFELVGRWQPATDGKAPGSLRVTSLSRPPQPGR